MRLFLLGLFCVFASICSAGEKRLILASTTSTQNSGLYNYLLPTFTKETGIDVHVVAVGTGQALRIARNGDADILVVHHRASEDAFIAQGFGLKRADLMYNDFVIVGPLSDPAAITKSKKISEAFYRLAKSKALFISRGDESGTHFKEIALWQQAAVAPQGDWYREIGAGMGAALNMAAAVNAYVLTDRGTWLSFNNKGNLALLFEGGTELLNPYGIIVVNPAKHPHVKVNLATILYDWMISDRGQNLIAAFTQHGQQLFCPTHAKATCAASALAN